MKAPMNILRVSNALNWDKVNFPRQAKKHIQPKLIAMAAEAGIELKLIDPDQDLEAQEPFSVLLHKIRDAGEHTPPVIVSA